MKKLIVLLFAINLCLFPQKIALMAQKPLLTLSECVEIALNTNPTLQVADMEIVRMDYSRKDVLAQLLPNIGFGANYSRTLAKQVAYMDFDMSALGGAFGGENQPAEGESKNAKSSQSDGIKMGRDNSWQLGFNASLPLIAPQLWASLDLSDSQIAQSIEQARASRLDLVNQVNAAYYQLLLAKDSKKVIQQSYDMASLTNEIYTKRFELGDASEYDVLRTSVAMKNVEPELLQSDIAIRRAELQLRLLMNLPADFEFDIAGQLSDFESTIYSETLSIDPDYSSNTSLVLNELQINTLSQSLKVANRAWYPTLALSASYNWMSSSNGNPFSGLRWSPYSIIGLTLNVPIYEGGSRWNKVKAAKIQIEQMRLNRETLEQSIAMQVNLAIDNIKLNVRQVASSNENVGQAEKAHSIMQQSFQIGAASYLDLRDAELALTQTRLSYYQSIYNYLIAKSELDLLLGRDYEK